MFIDSAQLTVKAGDGGRGCVAFRREKYVPHGGPSGGDGGKGGDIYLRSTCHLNNLLPFRYKRFYHARRGEHGTGSNCHGKNGEDLVIQVPLGSIIFFEESQTPLFDFQRENEQFLVAVGGRGGRGNARFASSTQQAPRFAEDGEPGEEVSLHIELKLLADLGLIGFPNSGKSTLISSISAAKPKIADYPFTTLIPHLGVVDCRGDRSFIVADIPGLIIGAHEGKGLGDHFLRHVERTRLLAHLVDVAAGAEGDPVERLEAINHELALYDASLARKEQIVVATKIDAMESAEQLEKLKTYCRRKRLAFLALSAVTNQGLVEFKRLVEKKLFRKPGGKSEAIKTTPSNPRNDKPFSASRE